MPLNRCVRAHKLFTEKYLCGADLNLVTENKCAMQESIVCLKYLLESVGTFFMLFVQFVDAFIYDGFYCVMIMS